MSELTSARLAEIAAGARPSADEARRIAASPALTRELATHDPSALLALLGGLDDETAADVPAYPGIAALETARPARFARRGTARAALAACAAAAATLALVLVGTPPQVEPSRVADATPTDLRLPAPPASVAQRLGGFDGDADLFDHDALPALVERVGSPTAEVVALIPPSAGGPVVSLIVDEEVGL